jgi:DNA modification methylase
MSIYYQDETITLHHGDALEVARSLEPGSVDCIVTSPPYYGLRDYGKEGQYGLEESPEAYVETMRALFNELRRVLSSDGTLWLNIGDTTKNKNLLGIPWRVALSLQDDGWILRSEIIWHKRNAVPEPVKDRPSRRHEHIFMFTKNRKNFFDLDSIRVPHTANGTHEKFATPWRDRPTNGATKSGPGVGGRVMGFSEGGKNPGDVWSISTGVFKGAHFATFPVEIPQRCIKAGCKPAGTVLDPFSGSGTTGMVARDEGRKYVGIDISADYLKLSLETRFQNGVLNLGGAA